MFDEEDLPEATPEQLIAMNAVARRLAAPRRSPEDLELVRWAILDSWRDGMSEEELFQKAQGNPSLG